MRKLENNYLNFWEEEINTSMKPDFYRLYKTGFCTSSYVDILRNTQIRKDFIKFCISNHNLCIEVGRHCKPKVLERNDFAKFVCRMKLRMKFIFCFIAQNTNIYDGSL